MSKPKINLPQFINRRLPLLTAISALLIYALTQFILRHFMVNFDESDHLAAGYLISQGQHLYRDIFSHHLPFPYYWTALFTPLWGEPHRALAMFRLSLLAFNLIAFSSLIFINRSSRSLYSFSLWLILISLLSGLFHGHLVLSDTIGAICIAAIAWLNIPLILKWETPSTLRSVTTSIFALIAVWTQFLLAPLLLIPFLTENWKKCHPIILTQALGIMLPLAFFYLNHQLPDFMEQVFWFNAKIYPQYYVDISNHGTSNHVILFFQNQLYWFTHFSTPLDLLQSLLNLGGLIFLAYIIYLKKWHPILIALLLFFATQVRGIKISPGTLFNAGIFSYLSFAFIAWTIFLFARNRKVQFTSVLVILITTYILITLNLPIYRQSLQPGYNYHVFWSLRQEVGQQIQAHTNPDDKVIIYPHDVDLYYFAQRKPIDRFLYYFPWINDVPKYRQERLTALETHPPKVIFIGSTEFRNQPGYYLQFFPNLITNYTPIYESQYGTLYKHSTEISD